MVAPELIGALDADMNQPPKIFNRQRYAMRRARAAAQFSQHDFLHRRVFDDIVDRLESVKRDFPKAVFSGASALTELITSACGVGEVVSMDLSPKRLPPTSCRIASDEEALPFARESLDLFVSVLTLHTVNDIVGALTQARLALKPDGLFIAAAFGEETLSILRNALYRAEAEITGGVSPRVAPFASIQDFGQALGRAGFALPVVDIDKVSVRYANPMKLLRDLRGMGETNALAKNTSPLRRDVLMQALNIFMENGGEERFDIVYATGWTPHESQQKPLRPGAGRMPLEVAVKKSN
jgi:SAM-dependent methyltransferase